jgi:microcystin degradation protein MlrC
MQQTAFVGYKCAPHTDTYETGIHAALMVIRTLEGGKKPTMAACASPCSSQASRARPRSSR